MNKLSFFGVKLQNESRKNIQPIDPETFYSQLAAAMKNHLLERYRSSLRCVDMYVKFLVGGIRCVKRKTCYLKYLTIINQFN